VAHKCDQLEISFNQSFRPRCFKGKISALEWAGMVPFRSDGLNSAYCGKPENLEDVEICTSSYLNSEELKKKFNEECRGKTNCQLRGSDYMINQDNEAMA
tara:strand:- start:1072 stop:1371 length:300 start_codon:yes stop_codon:yes gene_type:complete